jgi:hypothetical protein
LQDSATASHLGLAFVYGSGERNTAVYTVQLEGEARLTSFLRLQARLPYVAAAGDLGNHSGPGDLLVSAGATVYRANRLQLALTTGLRLPTGTTDAASDDGQPLPMPYQTGLGTTDLVDEELVHVVDPPRLIAALRPDLANRIPAGLEASLAIRTPSGCWVLRIGDGQIAFPPLERAPKDVVEMPHWMLTQLLTGYRGADELDVAMREDHAALLDRLFPKTWPASLSDPDHWTTAPQPRPYSARAAAAARETRLPWARPY